MNRLQGRLCPYEEILSVNVTMLGLVEVLLGHEHTLSEEVLVDLFAVCLWNEPGGDCSARSPS